MSNLNEQFLTICSLEKDLQACGSSTKVLEMRSLD